MYMWQISDIVSSIVFLYNGFEIRRNSLIAEEGS